MTTTNPNPTDNPKAASGAPRTRKRLLALLGLGALVAAAGYGAYYYSVARFHEDTDDAYVNGNLVQLTPQVSGTVVAVNADDTEIVSAGDTIVTLDPADARIALANAEAALGQTVRQVSALYVNNNTLAATVQQRQVDLSRARDDLRRRTEASESGAVAAEDVAHARDTVKAAEAALETAKQQLASNHALTDQASVANHPSVQAAATRVRDAYLANARNTLPAPVTGYVARRSVQVGQRVAPGNPLMAIVPLDGVWVDANFKEVQLKHIRIGQPVELHADLYGGKVTYHGKVVGFSAGTGSAFSALPAQNATGNWIKVVQRLPVRIALDPVELRAHPLQVGLSMQVDVETRERGGELSPAKATSTPIRTAYRTDVFERYGAEADSEIDRIIARNSNSNGDIATRNETTRNARPVASPSAIARAS
ncbi:HlyD family efflux transporter periplasmic adaptor subunit [Cupriavidus metallidurans]|uniref:HlyD family efflux transporter periplasmic adaptor subunit n=2 Tax=Burkholderiaceae TaxID=119060 RepID=A0A2L0XCL7_9BURK|nr:MULTISPECIES: HlyD family efflux transporter periplasmic adaptor subunit [Cupriavidus]AVA37749.1 EmrA/EmrK family multidrug efflux transporter periplasmic adaptor subunit [Cupriavidus metallidurans]KWR80810.1 hemolysin D [Cupriavidus sp. SHE]QBP14094.1 HlyD family efflux transporter periplasmic adaptor subunit [Cupriavidus metallidurans]QWC92564.1 HlyD family efflux transporter periplasmic adaptor subunit [Cupriavidus metallidurans]